MSPAWKVFAAIALSLSAFSDEEARPSLTLDVTGGTAREDALKETPKIAQDLPTPPKCPSRFTISTEIAPNLSFVQFNTLNTESPVYDIVYGASFSLAGIGIEQSFCYGQSFRLSFSGAYSGVLTGAGNGIYSSPSARGWAFDAAGEAALSLAADDARRVCFEPFAGFALLDISMSMRPVGLVREHLPWDHLRYYGPMAGLGLSLLPIETLRISAKIGYIRSRLWDKQQDRFLRRGGNRFYTVVSSIRLDCNVTKSLSAHANVDYQGWSAAQRYPSPVSAGVMNSVTPFLRRVIVGFGLKVAY